MKINLYFSYSYEQTSHEKSSGGCRPTLNHLGSPINKPSIYTGTNYKPPNAAGYVGIHSLPDSSCFLDGLFGVAVSCVTLAVV